MHRSPGNRDFPAPNSENPHLSSDQLLLLLDGELSSRETTQAKAHLEACWSCRARSGQIEEVISDFVAYRDCFKSSIPLSTDARATFLMQFRRLVQSVGKPSLARRVLDLFRASVSFVQDEFVPRHAYVTLIIVGAFTLFFLLRFWEVPRVSASQFLMNAQASEVQSLEGVSKPVVYQKLRIRVGDETIARTIYRDLAGNRQVDYLDKTVRGYASRESSQGTNLNSNQELNAEFEQTFRNARLNWKDPLSATNYSLWHSTLSQKRDDVQVKQGLLTLKTTTTEGAIREATITVRTRDFHPVAEDLYLNNSQQVEVTELAWQVIPFEAIDSAIFTPERVPSPVIIRPTRPASVTPTDAELAETELRARIAIHAEGADLGEQIEFDRSITNAARRFLVVRGIVNTTERKAELSAALEGIPNIELEIRTLQEAALEKEVLVGDKSEGTESSKRESQDFTPPPVGRKPDSPAEKGTPADVAVSKPAIEEQLERRFPNPDDRLRFVNGAIKLAQDSLVQAWALRRLQDHYTDEEVALLSYDSRQNLELLIRDHVSRLSQNVDALRDLISPVLSEPVSTAEPTPTTDEGSQLAAEPASDWRSSISQIFPNVQSMEIQLVALVGDPGEPVPDAQSGVRGLRVALAKLEMQIAVFNQHVSIGFLE